MNPLEQIGRLAINIRKLKDEFKTTIFEDAELRNAIVAYNASKPVDDFKDSSMKSINDWLFELSLEQTFSAAAVHDNAKCSELMRSWIEAIQQDAFAAGQAESAKSALGYDTKSEDDLIDRLWEVLPVSELVSSSFEKDVHKLIALYSQQCISIGHLLQAQSSSEDSMKGKQ
jgi:hypothetical protein